MKHKAWPNIFLVTSFSSGDDDKTQGAVAERYSQ
jgi:hypothetical protein